MIRATVATADGVVRVESAEHLAELTGWTTQQAERALGVACEQGWQPCFVMTDVAPPDDEPDPPTDEKLRKSILDTATDLASSFAFYDRKEDEALSGDDLEDAVRRGVVTLDEIVAAFRGELEYLEGDS